MATPNGMPLRRLRKPSRLELRAPPDIVHVVHARVGDLRSVSRPCARLLLEANAGRAQCNGISHRRGVAEAAPGALRAEIASRQSVAVAPASRPAPRFGTRFRADLFSRRE
jgi:hypothetical protein